MNLKYGDTLMCAHSHRIGLTLHGPIRWFFAGVALVLVLHQAQAGEGPQTVRLADPQGVSAAMVAADRDRLQQIATHPQNEFEGELAKMALKRVEGRFDEADQALGSCEQALPATHPMRGLCSLILAGNLFMQRRLDSWWQQLLWIRHTYYPALAKGYPGQSVVLADAEGAQLLPETAIPSPEVNWRQAQGEIPYLSPAQREGLEGRLLPVIAVQVGDASRHALVDTGSSFEIIDPDLAKQLGVRPLLDYRRLTDATGKVLPAPIGILPSLQLGPVTVHNWPVHIARTPVSMVIGLPLLQRLGQVQLDGDRLSLARHSDGHCRRPLQLAASIDGSVSKLLYPIQIDGRPASSLIDTGSADFINGVATLLPAHSGSSQRQAVVYGGSTQWVASYPMQAKVDIGGGAKLLSFKAYDQAFALTPYQLGSPILQHHRLIMDFERHSLCIEAQAEPKDGGG